ncbi:metabotropic glutamate receptor 4-like [Branchiostoma floridae]|uniref:Metabotropic glutamate receptor 4-like n=1 Tax=Branchiostoma floridae TaxID=7739 RepID=A0A9J7LYM6_BRAFL|nr:metabotropic glutamate receptor 4-like [Branchiostoma floridae]
MNITMYDQAGAEGVPDSDCLRDCSRCRPLKEDKKYAHLSGDVLVNGLFPVHGAGDTTFVCGDINKEKGIQTLEAFLYAIRRINQDANLLPSVSLGTLALRHHIDIHISGRVIDHKVFPPSQVLDTCYSPIQAGQDVSNLQSRVVTYGVPDVDVYDIIGYVGALSSDVTVDVADVLTSLGIPQISWGSTSTLLSNADDYPFFLRTVPSDDLQGEAIAALVDYFDWNYVAIVSSDTVYGRSGITAFRQAADNYDICVSFSHVVPRDATDEQLEAIITALRENTRARAVVSFVTDSDARALLQAATRLNARGELIWIGSDSWGNQVSVVDGLDNAARGSLTITLENNPVAGFEDYFKALTPDSNSDNPWFQEFWEDHFGCNLPGGTKYADNCSPSHSLTQGFQQASFVPQVMNAVYAFAHGLDVLLREHCSGAQGVCSQLTANQNFKQLLLEKIKEQRFTGADGQPVQFNDDGSVTMGFTIWNYVRVRPGVYEYKDAMIET